MGAVNRKNGSADNGSSGVDEWETLKSRVQITQGSHSGELSVQRNTKLGDPEESEAGP